MALRDGVTPDVYLPILRGRRGELDALAMLPRAAVPAMLPILEVVPSPAGPVRDAYRFFVALRDRLPAGLAVGVDLGRLPDPTSGLRHPALDLAQDLAAWDLPMYPVIRPGDSAGRLARHRAASRLHLDRVVVRFRPLADARDEAGAHEVMQRVWRISRLLPEQCDLLIDLGLLDQRDTLAAVGRTVRRVVHWAWEYPWHSISVAAGSMPPSLRHVPRQIPYRLARQEVRLWRQVAHLGVGYGDYGVCSPEAPAAGSGWRPMPTLRYTSGDGTWIYRWPRHNGSGDEPFHELCRALVFSGHFPTAADRFCWGDREVERRAFGSGGPGNATDWLAWGTSRHLSEVVAGMVGPAGASGQDGYADRMTVADIGSPHPVTESIDPDTLGE